MDNGLLQQTLNGLGEPSYRAQQVWEWAARGAKSYEEMSNLPLPLRQSLEADVPLSALALDRVARSRDGTEKALFHTADGRPLEAVLMSYRDGRRSVCVSSQSGCPLTCSFCATGKMRFARNLTTSEILDQVLHFRRKEDVDHLVFMGMGEPLMNLDNVLGACELLPDTGIATSHTTVSTVGWVPGIERLATEGPAVRLALSLHAPNDQLRSELMPVNDRYPLSDVLEACLAWHRARRRKVYIEYLMLAGVNDSLEQARDLAALLGPGGPFKVNLIPFNPSDSGFEGSSRNRIDDFRAELDAEGIPATVRLTRGRDIDAACGQLAARDAGPRAEEPVPQSVE